MGISEKLAYLNETKNQIKSALNTPYNVFRDYPTLISKYVKNQPKSIVEGSTAICENAIDLPCTITVNGNSYQETTEGYNEFDLRDFVSNVKGVTVTQNKDMSFNATGTGTGNYITFKTAKNIINELEDGETYTIWANKANPLFYAQVQAYKADGTVSYYTTDYSTRTQFKVDKTNYKSYNIKLQSGGSSSGKEYNLSNMQFMLYKGTDNKPYEPFTNGVATPNPDYKQDIEVIDMVNRFDKDNVNVLNAYFNNIANPTLTQLNSAKTVYVECKENTEYTISKMASARFYVGYTTELPAIGVEVKNRLGSEVTIQTQQTIETGDNAKYLVIFLYNSTYDTTITFEEILDSLLIYEGTQDLPYLPYGCIGLEQRGKNKFDKDNPDNFLNSLMPDNAGKIQAATTNISSPGYIVTIIVPCKPNSNYIISRYIEGKTFFVYESTNKNLKIGDNTTLLKRSDNTGIISERVTTSANAKYILVKIYNTYTTEPNTYEYLISSVQIEEGTEATPYEPYREPKIYPINLDGNSLAKAYIEDNLKIYVNGEVELIKNNIIETLDGDEEIRESLAKYDDVVSYQYTLSKSTTLLYRNKVICNFLRNKIVNENSEHCFIDTVANQENYNGFNMFFPKSIAPSLEDLKQWLSENNLEVMYSTDTPETITLPSIEPITLFEGTNVFELITNLGTTIKVEYIVNAEKINESEG